MFGKMFPPKKFNSPSGFFKVEKDKFIPLDELPGNGSINDAKLSTGYPINHVHTIHSFNASKIEFLGVKLFTREPLMVFLKDKNLDISKDELDKAISQVDWDFEYGSLEVEDMLDAGITQENLSLDFLQSVLVLTKEDENLYKCNQFKLFLQFEGNLLKHFTSSDLESTSTKWLKNINPQMVQDILAEAMAYHGNEFGAKEELNKQTDALRDTPQAINNPYLHLHRTSRNNISFYNILITHYGQPCTLQEFLFMNKGRYQDTGNNTYKVGRFIYAFNEDGELENSTQLH